MNSTSRDCATVFAAHALTKIYRMGEIDQQFVVAMRQDATVNFVEPRSERAVHAVERLPGVMDVEPMRVVPVRLRAGQRSRTLAITGLPRTPHLNRVVDRAGQAFSLPAEGLVISKMLGAILDVVPGSSVRVEVLEGARPVLDVPVVALVDDSMGLQAYMEIDAVRRMMREGGVTTGAAVTLDAAATGAFSATVKTLPVVAGVSLREVMLRSFRDTMAQNMSLQVFINVIFAGIIAFGVVYNSARVSLSERERELASLRVLGFTRAEISLILLGELAVVTVAALPIGAVLGAAAARRACPRRRRGRHRERASGARPGAGRGAARAGVAGTAAAGADARAGARAEPCGVRSRARGPRGRGEGGGRIGQCGRVRRPGRVV